MHVFKSRPRPKRNSAVLSLESLERRDLLSVTGVLDDAGLATLFSHTAEWRYAEANESREVSPPGAQIHTVVVTAPTDASLPLRRFVYADSAGIEADAFVSPVATSADSSNIDPSAGELLSGLNIVINAGATLAANQAALDAFHRAAQQWEAIFSDPITVTINADLVNLGNSSIIGQASSVILSFSHNTVRSQLIADADSDDTIVASLPRANQFTVTLPPGFGLAGSFLSGTKANLKAAGFTGLDGQYGATDATIQFNTLFAFDFDNSNGVTPGTMDFETVAAHEIGHALGFVSIVDTIDSHLDAGTTANVTPRLLDLFRFADNVSGQDPSTASQFTTYPRLLTTGGNPIFDDTVNEWRLSTGAYTGDGRQASHWKDNNLTGTLIGILDPTIAYGQVVAISAADVRALDLIGWDYVAPPNEPPVLDPIGNKSGVEGNLLSFTATASDPNLFDSLTYSLGPGAPIGASIHPTSGLFTWTPSDNYFVPQAVTIIVSDNGTPVMSDSETILITVANVAPTAGLSGPVSGVRGEPRTYTLTAADPSPVDQFVGFTFAIDWNGDLVTDQTIFGPSGTMVSHVFADAGNFNIRVTATDKDGGASSVFTLPVTVSTWATRPNGGNPLLTDLVWGGNPAGDGIVFHASGGNLSVRDTSWNLLAPVFSGVTGDVIYYGQNAADTLYTANVHNMQAHLGGGDDNLKAYFTSGGNFSIWGGTGNDAILFFAPDSMDIHFDGGDGNDSLGTTDSINTSLTFAGGSGADELILVGGANAAINVDMGDGDDVVLHLAVASTTNLLGGGGNDIILSLAGADFIDGGDGDDLLIGGPDDVNDGDDTLLGGNGNDVLIGWTGAGSLSGGAGEDLIIAGSLSLDLFGEEEVPGILQMWLQWLQPEPVATRVAYLTGALTGGIIDPAYVLVPGTTVFDDGAVDTVLGEADADWLLYDIGEDISDYSLGVDLRMDIG